MGKRLGSATDGSAAPAPTSEVDWRLVFDAIGHPAVILSPDHRIVEANAATEAKMGVPRGGLRGRYCYEVFHQEDRHADGCPLQKMVGTGQLETVDMEMQAFGGTYLVSCTPVTNHQGDLEQVIHIATDITDRRALEDQLRHAQKMEAVGRLAGGVAHDFNNVLAVILNCALFVKESVSPESDAARDAEEIERAAQRAATLTRQLLAFSRKQLVRTRALSLNEVVMQAERMLERLVGEDVNVTTDLAADLGLVRADGGLVEQVLVNLAVNARDALPDGGNLAMRTRTVELGEDDARRTMALTAGRHVVLEVSDDGVGMPAAVAERIFEPFFTTKDAGQGTGLGLSTVYGIIKQLEGHIEVDTELGRGTTFRIHLPEYEPQKGPSAQPPARPSPPPAGRVILLVEDEAPLRKLLVRILSSAGHQVLEATDAKAAMAQLEGYEGPIHLLLTDLILPGPSGKVLAEWLAQLRPEMRVVFMSGYSDEIVGRHGVLSDDIHYLPKPFDANQLNAKLREALGEEPE